MLQSSFAFLGAGIQKYAVKPIFHCWLWGSNLGHYTCSASSLASEPSPQSLKTLFCSFLVWLSLIKVLNPNQYLCCAIITESFTEKQTSSLHIFSLEYGSFTMWNIIQCNISCIAITSSANQGFTEDVNQLWSMGCIYKPPAFINKVLLEHSHVHFFVYLWLIFVIEELIL